MMGYIFGHGKTKSSDCSQPLSRIVTVREIKSEFPKFCKAVTESYSLLNPAVELNEFILCAAYSYAENVMKRKRFQVYYTHLAYVSGFSNRTKLPEAVEAVEKLTWHVMKGRNSYDSFPISQSVMQIYVILKFSRLITKFNSRLVGTQRSSIPLGSTHITQSKPNNSLSSILPFVARQ